MILRTNRWIPVVLLVVVPLAVAGCVLVAPGIQILELHFELADELAEGVEALVHQQGLPSEVVLKKYFVRVGGRIAGATSLPERVDVLVTAESADDGKIYNRFKLKAKVDGDGGFAATAKWKKNIEPETLLSVFLTPVGADLAGDLGIDLCVHIAKKKSDLGQIADCAPGTFNLPAAYELELDSVGFHEPITVTGVFPADLGDTAGRELVVALRDEGRPNQVCPEEVPWDGCAAVDWDDVDGKRNAPPGGGYFENKVSMTTEDGRLVLFLNRSLTLERELDDDFALG